jgi:hypothetical protein
MEPIAPEESETISPSEDEDDIEEEPEEVEETYKSKNEKLFAFLYDRFIEDTNTDLETMERFIENINPIFEEHNSNMRIEIYNEDFIRENPKYQEADVQQELIGEDKYIPDDLIISLINFLFNPGHVALIYRAAGESDEVAQEFNDLARRIGSRIRVISYTHNFEGAIISLGKLI